MADPTKLPGVKRLDWRSAPVYLYLGVVALLGLMTAVLVMRRNRRKF